MNVGEISGVSELISRKTTIWIDDHHLLIRLSSVLIFAHIIILTQEILEICTGNLGIFFHDLQPSAFKITSFILIDAHHWLTIFYLHSTFCIFKPDILLLRQIDDFAFKWTAMNFQWFFRDAKIHPMMQGYADKFPL